MNAKTLQTIYDDLNRDRAPEKRIFGSPHWIDLLKKMQREPLKSSEYLGIKVVEHGAFPIAISYPACDIETKEEIRVYSGEYIHAAMIPVTLDEGQNRVFNFYNHEEEVIKMRDAFRYNISILKW